jgi:hypothetical protein
MSFLYKLLGQIVRFAAKTPVKISALIPLGSLSQSVAHSDTWSQDDTTREMLYMVIDLDRIRLHSTKKTCVLMQRKFSILYNP